MVIKAIYQRRYQSLNEAIKRRDLAIRAIVKNPDEFASIGQVARVTDLIGELKEQITQEDSVLLEISAKLEQTQRYVEEQERNNLSLRDSDVSSEVNPGTAANQQPPSPARVVRLNREQRDSFKSLQGEIEGSLLELANLASAQSLESDADNNNLELLRKTLEASKETLEKVNAGS